MDHRSEIELHGHCAPEFARVADAFASNFASAGEIGAAVAVCVEGELVVDLWGGSVLRDDRVAGPWRADTIVRMMSVNKAMTALCAHLLIDRGLLDLTEPVARYWPEFAQAGKQDITVRQLLGGLAGLIYPDEVPAGSAYDWDRMVEGLAAQAPAFPPGTRGAYHSSTYGHLVGELVRRVDGRRPGQFFREEIAAPFEIDYWFAVPESERHRVSGVRPNPASDTYSAIGRGPSTPLGRAWRILPNLSPSERDSPAHWGLEFPSGNGRGNARAAARLFGILAQDGRSGGRRLVSEATLARAIALQWDTPCALTGRPYRYGLGFFLNSPGLVPMGPNMSAFGHPGAGGALVFSDPSRRLSFAYCGNFMCEGAGVGVRCERLVNALFETGPLATRQ